MFVSKTFSSESEVDSRDAAVRDDPVNDYCPCQNRPLPISVSHSSYTREKVSHPQKQRLFPVAESGYSL